MVFELKIIPVRMSKGYGDARTVVLEAPGMVTACEPLGIALFEPADQGSTMGTAINEYVDGSVILLHENDWSSANAATYEVVWIWQFSLVAYENPRISKEIIHLVIEDLLLM